VRQAADGDLDGHGEIEALTLRFPDIGEHRYHSVGGRHIGDGTAQDFHFHSMEVTVQLSNRIFDENHTIVVLDLLISGPVTVIVICASAGPPATPCPTLKMGFASLYPSYAVTPLCHTL